MWAYYFILSIEIILFLSCSKYNKKQQKECLLLSMFILFVFSAFRDITVGGDLERYLPEFNNISKENFFKIIRDGYGTRERGFAIFEKIISFLSSNPFAFISVNSFVFIYCSYKAIRGNSCNYILSSLLFTLLLYTNSYNIIRASLVVVIGLNMLQSIICRRPKTFYLLLLLAVSIQRTSIALLPMYYLWNLKFKAIRLYIAIIGSLILSFLLSGSGVLNILIDVFGYTIKDEGELDFWSENSAGLTTMALFLLALTVYTIFVYSKSKVSDKLCEFYITLLTISTCIQFFSSILTVVNRFSLFYYSYIIFALPYLFMRLPKSFPTFIKSMLIIAFIALYILGLWGDVQHIVPYKFINL